MRVAFIMPLLFCLALACGPFKKAERVQPEVSSKPEPATQPEARTGEGEKESSASASRVAGEMTADCLSRAWIPAYVGVTGNKPVVTVGPIHNWTDEQIDTQPFAASCERELSQSDQVSFVASQRQWGQSGEKGGHQKEFVSPETVGRIKTETGANFILAGAIRLMSDKTEGGSSPYHQLQLEMVNIKTMARVWEGSKQIKIAGPKKQTQG